MKLVQSIVALAIVLMPGAVFGQDGALTVRATVVGSVHLEIQYGGQTASGAGTATYTASLGTLAGMQFAPSGFTLNHNEADTTLTSTLNARALKANLPNSGYALAAHLQHASPDGVTWRLNGVVLSAEGSSSVAAETFGTVASLDLTIAVTDSAATAPLANQIVFTVLPN